MFSLRPIPGLTPTTNTVKDLSWVVAGSRPLREPKHVKTHFDQSYNAMEPFTAAASDAHFETCGYARHPQMHVAWSNAQHPTRQQCYRWPKADSLKVAAIVKAGLESIDVDEFGSTLTFHSQPGITAYTMLLI